MLGRQILRLKILLVTLLQLECGMKEISFVIDRSGLEYTNVLCHISFMVLLVTKYISGSWWGNNVQQISMPRSEHACILLH